MMKVVSKDGGNSSIDEYPVQAFIKINEYPVQAFIKIKLTKEQVKKLLPVLGCQPKRSLQK
jgi:hypothetical protein